MFWLAKSPHFGRSFSLPPPFAIGRSPSRSSNPTCSFAARRLTTSGFWLSNRDLAYLTHSEISRNGQPSDIDSISMLVWRSAYPASGLRISTAARLNANFPLVVASPRLPTDPSRRIMDAGYYDNYGCHVAARWLYENRFEIDALDLSGVLLVQIAAAPLDRKPLASKQARRGNSTATWKRNTYATQ